MTHLMFAPLSRGLESAKRRFVDREYELKSLAFPCDAAGRVNLDTLDERSRNEYLFARAMTGRDYAFPLMASCDR
jgi:hypothetical protein